MLLKRYNIGVLIDVRRFPKSKKFPHFNRENLKRELSSNNIRYLWLGESLGGFREGGYIKYMCSSEFKRGFNELLNVLEEFSADNIVIMCSERFWFRCHRRFIADKLVEHNYMVVHIIDESSSLKHRFRGYAKC